MGEKCVKIRTYKGTKGDIAIDPTVVNVSRNVDSIRWELEKGKGSDRFDLVFYEGNPLGYPEVSQKGDDNTAFQVTGDPGFYHYKVVAVVDGEVFKDVACPSIKVM